MNFEITIAKIERVSVRIAALSLLILSLLALVVYGLFEFVGFVSRLIRSL
jgi:hypothetical protein